MKTKCPYCKYVANRHETLEREENPNENDVSFCANCGEVSLFKKEGNVKVDLDSLDEDAKTEINDIRIAWLKSNAIRNLK